MAVQFLAGFVHTNERLFVAVFLGIHVEDLFHLSHESRPVALGDAPALFPPGLQLVFFRVRRTVSAEICVTMRRLINSSARSCMVQCVRPAGALLQQMAINCASA